MGLCLLYFFFFKQKTAYEIYQCDWSSDVCSSDLRHPSKLEPSWMRRLLAAYTLVFAVSSTVGLAGDGNRLVYLDGNDPFYVSRTFPKLTTPQWVGEAGVEAVAILSIDDMREVQRWEEYVRPILERLKKIDGRAPLSIFTCNIDPRHPHLQKWLAEGVSLEVHTIDHPCPLLQKGDFAAARATCDRCIDLMDTIPGSRAVAFRMPCADSINSPSPRFYAEIFNRVTQGGNFLSIDSSLCNILTPNDPELPRELVLDAKAQEIFRKYLPFKSFVATIEDYSYPYVIGRLCWEFPIVVPTDWSAQNLRQPDNPRSVADLGRALDAAVVKQGVYTLAFHPHNWIKNTQIVEIVEGLLARKRIVYLCTNALLLLKYLDKLPRHPNLTLSIHLDGMEKDHDRVVAKDGTFNIATEAIRRAKKQGFRVNSNTTLFQDSTIEEVEEFFDFLKPLGVDGITVSSGFEYADAPDQDKFLGRQQTHEFFEKLLAKNTDGRWDFNHSPFYLEFLSGKRNYDCTPWGNPNYSVLGWQKPCYLLDEGYADSFEKLMESTEWDKYGHRNNEKCANCTAHCGYEPTAVVDSTRSLKNMIHSAKAIF